MQFFKICNIAVFYYIILPYSPVMPHLTYYISNVYPRDLASLKISKRFNDELIHKASIRLFEYSHSRENSMEQKYIHKELLTIHGKIRKLYRCYKHLLERDPLIDPQSRQYLKKITDEFYDILFMVPFI